MLKGGADRFYDIVKNRRSVRKYSRRPVDYEIVRKCILAAGEFEIGKSSNETNFNLQVPVRVEPIPNLGFSAWLRMLM